MQKRLLVVDDYEDARELLEVVFRHAGFVVFMAANGADSLSAVKRHRPHAVVMDLFMPVMDGFEATRQIKSDAQLKDIPVIAYSAKASSAHPQEHLFAAVCQKPCAPEVLVAVVNDAIANHPLDE